MGMVELCYTDNPPIAGGFVFISHCFINRDILPIRPLLWLSAIISTCEEIANVKLGSCLMHLGYFCEKCSEASFNYTLQRILYDSLLQCHQLLLAPMPLIFSLSTFISHILKLKLSLFFYLPFFPQASQKHTLEPRQFTFYHYHPDETFS